MRQCAPAGIGRSGPRTGPIRPDGDRFVTVLLRGEERSDHEEGLALILDALQPTNNLFGAQVVSIAQARGQSVEPLHFTAAQASLFRFGSQPKGPIERGIGSTGAVEIKNPGHTGKGPSLIPKDERLVIPVCVFIHAFPNSPPAGTFSIPHSKRRHGDGERTVGRKRTGLRRNGSTHGPT
jgi:hypothetical protein